MGDSPFEELVEHRPLDLSGEMAALPDSPSLDGDELQRLTVRDLVYVHPGDGPRVGPVSLTIERGSLTVLTGEIGSGKSTFLRVLLGLLTADKGEVLWNDRPIERPAEFMVPPRVAYKPQLPRLFSGELREAIELGVDCDEATMSTVLGQVAFDEDVDAMPNGLATQIGSRGLRLSGGQVQRVSMARMLVRDTQLYVVDDVSSGLDQATGRRVLAALDGLLSQGVTLLVASHDRNVLERADEIHVFEDGRVVERGPLASLQTSSPVVRGIVGTSVHAGGGGS